MAAAGVTARAGGTEEMVGAGGVRRGADGWRRRRCGVLRVEDSRGRSFGGGAGAWGRRSGEGDMVSEPTSQTLTRASKTYT